MSITPQYPASEAEHNPYAYGYNNAADHATTAARIAAFGAIRRAVEVARRYDVPCDGPGHNTIPRNQAAGIRRAIRAAIGSEKA